MESVENTPPLVFLAVLYLAPTIYAFARRLHNRWSVFLCSFLLGWTVIGWAVGFVFTIVNDWSCRFARIVPIGGKLGGYNCCLLPLINGRKKDLPLKRA
jgi:hypothetical protein